MNLRNERQSRKIALPDEPASRILLALLVVTAGIGAAVAPFVADLLTAGAGIMIAWLAFAAWTGVRQGHGPAATTKLLEAV